MCSRPPHTFFLFNHTPTTQIYTLSLHDALPILVSRQHRSTLPWVERILTTPAIRRRSGIKTRALTIRSRACPPREDRKSTRLNSSHTVISYAVFCLKKKKKKRTSRSSQEIVVDM